MRTISEYFAKEKEVYIVNRTNPLGVVTLALGEEGNVFFSVPKVTDPIVLTNYVPKAQIESSVSFRHLVSKGLIELLTEEEYLELVKNADVEKVEKEVEKLQLKAVPVLEEVEGQREESVQKEVVTSEVGSVNSKVVQTLHLLTLKGNSEVGGVVPSVDSVINDFENMSLTRDDLEYIAAKSRGKLKKWVMEKLAKLE
uniref:Uncharacterized protein n=1 Tax=candidate division CPR3 bacterium TaxID=2268181 RepID=A0A7V3N4A2_UNCC3